MRDVETARARAGLLRAIREFFAIHHYLETDTPSLATELIPEAHIPVFETRQVHPWEPERSYYLIPSPEVHMKTLLAEGYGNIFRLGPAFRNAENRSRIHNPEFTMLEWYTVHADYRDSIRFCRELLAAVAPRFASAEDESEILTMEEAFERYAGAPKQVFAREHGMRETALSLDMRVAAEESEEELFQRIFLSHVEPALATVPAVFLTDYPSMVPSLATRNRDRPELSERWELYLDGIEIANCYTEERDRAVLERFLEREQRECENSDSGPFAPPARSLLRFTDAPSCSGVALGVDRLLMVLCGEADIRGVIFSG